MRNTKWMILCLFIGFLMAAGMMSAVPIYMNASLQRILIKDMQEYQLDTGLYPGEYAVSVSLPLKTTTEERITAVNTLSSLADEQTRRIAMPAENSKLFVSDGFQYLMGGKTTRAKMIGMTGIEQHVEIIDGRMFSPQRADDGSFEIICNEEALKVLDIVCGQSYPIQNSFYSQTAPLSVTVVGVFKLSDSNDSYWSESMDDYLNGLFMDYDLFMSEYIMTGVTTLNEIAYRRCFDYNNLNLNTLNDVTENLAEDFELYPAYGYQFRMGVYDILTEYAERADNLKELLWILQIPSIVMLAFYLFMVSQLNVEQEKNEIAVFKSRGASSRQIFAIYALETGVLGLATLITAPFIGLLLCSFLGVSNGFLEFVNRTGLASRLSVDAVIYALIAVVIFFVTTMLPIIPASKLSIVKYKQS